MTNLKKIGWMADIIPVLPLRENQTLISFVGKKQ
jgi:hypothetical protein